MSGSTDLARALAAAIEESWTTRAHQIPPLGDWTIWLLLGGRSAGKTRAGAEWVRTQVQAGCSRIALVAATAADVRDVLVEGESGLLRTSPDYDRPVYSPGLRRVEWRNGATAHCFSADEPDRLRGPQFNAAWADELAAWRDPA